MNRNTVLRKFCLAHKVCKHFNVNVLAMQLQLAFAALLGLNFKKANTDGIELIAQNQGSPNYNLRGSSGPLHVVSKKLKQLFPWKYQNSGC